MFGLTEYTGRFVDLAFIKSIYIVLQSESTIEARAMCRLIENKVVSTTIADFRKQYPEWQKEVPVLLKVSRV